MNPKELIENDLKKGETQTGVAMKIGVSNATIYKILYTQTRPTVATLEKIAKAYGVPVTSFLVAEGKEQYLPSALTDKEQKLILMFRKLDERRRDRFLENLEDMVLAAGELSERGSRETGMKKTGGKRKQND
ncbi:MAG TPA: helix-turn-helix transcriptional regulator [Geobacteraceae bacterium]|nr:helix-turn-helix transcriptional regulator [Geobacteraceae bacterium]